jgi:hypothetical protein
MSMSDALAKPVLSIVGIKLRMVCASNSWPDVRSALDASRCNHLQARVSKGSK